MISRTFSDISGHFGRWAGLGGVGRGARVVGGCTFMLGSGNRGWQGAGVIKPGAGKDGGATTRVAPTGWVVGVGRGCCHQTGGGDVPSGRGYHGAGKDGAGRPRGATTRVGWWGTWGGRPHPSPPPEGEGILWFVTGWGVGVGRGCCHQTGGGGVPSGRGTMGRARTGGGAATGGQPQGLPLRVGWWGIWGGDAPTLALPRRGRGFCGLLRVGGWGWGGA